MIYSERKKKFKLLWIFLSDAYYYNKEKKLEYLHGVNSKITLE